MIDHEKFLRDAASELRELARRAPLIGEALRRLANELDAKAVDLESKDKLPSSDEP